MEQSNLTLTRPSPAQSREREILAAEMSLRISFFENPKPVLSQVEGSTI
jgi:hypothetical protein